MIVFNAILNGAILILIAIGGYVLIAAKAAVKTSAEEAARAVIRELEWPAELGRELQKSRGVERQELRFKSYGGLWKELWPLAIYDDVDIDRGKIEDLSKKLKNWYFSECGGLLLTPQAREFYFALQDLLRATLKVSEGWSTARLDEPEKDYHDVFLDVLNKWSPEVISVMEYFKKGKFENWQVEASDLGGKWRKGIKKVAGAWKELNDEERFVNLQQVGSKLRTSLTTDLESRLL